MTKLSDLVSTAHNLKSIADEAKKKADEAKRDLTEYLNKEGISKGNFDGISFTWQVQERRSMDEEKLLEIIKELIEDNPGVLPDDLVIQKEVVNEDTLEKLVYDGVIVEEDIAEAITIKNIKVLRMKKVR